MQEKLTAQLGGTEGVIVLASEGTDDLLPAAMIAVAFELAGCGVELRYPDQGSNGRWAEALEGWFREQGRSVRLASGLESARGDDASVVEVYVATVPDTAATPSARLVAVIGPKPDDPRLAFLVANGGVLGVETVPRFGSTGRHFVELVEHVHHAAGPSDQSTSADVLRAALFGRLGLIPVNLATRQAPVEVAPWRTLVWFLDPAELGAASAAAPSELSA